MGCLHGGVFVVCVGLDVFASWDCDLLCILFYEGGGMWRDGFSMFFVVFLVGSRLVGMRGL